MLSAMTAFRLIPLPVHAALEMVTGLMTMAAPFALGFGPAATVVAVFAGAIIFGIALSAATGETSGRGTMAIGTHHAADYGIAIGLTGAAALVAFDGDPRAGMVLAALALVQFALNLTTRYSMRG